ncbi:MAG: sugar ABC transporter permease [Thermomicrobiales bacterium]
MTAESDVALPTTTAAELRLKRRWYPSKIERKQLLLASIFIGPWVIGLLGFILYPIAYTIYLSFTRYGGLGDPVWIGLANYRRFFTDPNFENALFNTLYYTGLAVPIGVVIAMMLALAMNTDLPEIPIYRAILFLPSVLPLFALSFIFKALLDPNKGIVNELLRNVGFSPPNWFGNPDFAKIGIVMIAQFGAGQVALVFLAGLKGIPQHLYEAAMIDGAGPFNRFFKITIPLMTPVILYDLILGISMGLQVFTQAYIITDGGPAKSTTFLVLYLYENAFKFGGQMGFASAIGVFLFALTFLIALVVFKTSSKWVHYDLT